MLSKRKSILLSVWITLLVTVTVSRRVEGEGEALPTLPCATQTTSVDRLSERVKRLTICFSISSFNFFLF